MLFSLCFCQKNTHKTHKIVKVVVINDNNNFAPSLFRSLCEFVVDCLGPRYFSSGAALPQKNTSVQNNHLRFHTMTSKKMVRSYYCLSKAKQHKIQDITNIPMNPPAVDQCGENRNNISHTYNGYTMYT